ncbi:hypothetical protein B0H65DRAFT_442827 [Neurospora tetraspora]|uniref:Uncharacterized protein n=1 Tax=Neurospora tetraspora TaxID=94610 RepID=A0AAE0MRW2_9PEZI|nr:hypothetical protein B0H65DRAFT_442827 [Neurospora tetraspora]
MAEGERYTRLFVDRKPRLKEPVRMEDQVVRLAQPPSLAQRFLKLGRGSPLLSGCVGGQREVVVRDWRERYDVKSSRAVEPDMTRSKSGSEERKKEAEEPGQVPGPRSATKGYPQGLPFHLGGGERGWRSLTPHAGARLHCYSVRSLASFREQAGWTVKVEKWKLSIHLNLLVIRALQDKRQDERYKNSDLKLFSPSGSDLEKYARVLLEGNLFNKATYLRGFYF